MANWLVTGGCGFIGSHLVEALVAAKHSVVVLDDLSSGSPRNLSAVSAVVDMRQGDVRAPSALKAAMRDIDYVAHLAARLEEPVDNVGIQALYDVNAAGTLAVCAAAAAAGVKRLIYGSSAAVYGQAPSTREDMWHIPISFCGYSKVAGEMYCLAFHQMKKLDCVCLRYFNVYGARQKVGVVANFIRNVVAGQPPVIFGDSTKTRDFIHVSDAVRATILAADVEGALGKAINIGTGLETGIDDLGRKICQIGNQQRKFLYRSASERDISYSRADTSRARRYLGFAAETALEDGLRATYEWYVPAVLAEVG